MPTVTGLMTQEPSGFVGTNIAMHVVRLTFDLHPLRYLGHAQFVFMDNSSYEEVRIQRDDEWAKYLKEGAEVQLSSWNGKVIAVDVPNTLDLLVTETDPGVKGNTASGECHSSRYR